MPNRKLRTGAVVALAVVVAICVAALAGVSAANPGKGKGKALGKTAKTHAKASSPSSAEYQYGSGGKQYGRHKVVICHKGHTIRIAQPAVKAHLRHGDTPGVC